MSRLTRVHATRLSHACHWSSHSSVGALCSSSLHWSPLTPHCNFLCRAPPTEGKCEMRERNSGINCMQTRANSPGETLLGKKGKSRLGNKLCCWNSIC